MPTVESMVEKKISSVVSRDGGCPLCWVAREETTKGRSMMPRSFRAGGSGAPAA